MISEEDTDKYLAEALEILKETFDGGDKSALLQAIRYCCWLRRPLPEWLRVAFLAAYDSATGYEIKSWDDAFGRPHPKGAHLRTEKRNLELRPVIIGRVQALRTEMSVDKELFEKIGKDLGISGTIVSDIYYEERSRLSEITDRLNEIIDQVPGIPRKIKNFREDSTVPFWCIRLRPARCRKTQRVYADGFDSTEYNGPGDSAPRL
jgi:hypothetical protein